MTEQLIASMRPGLKAPDADEDKRHSLCRPFGFNEAGA